MADDYLNILPSHYREQLRDVLEDADTVLLCDQGKTEVKFHSTILSLNSVVFRNMLRDLKITDRGVQPLRIPAPDDTASDWAYVQALVYPLRPRSKPTPSTIQILLKLGAKYNIRPLMIDCQEYIGGVDLDLDSYSTGYVLTWLRFADAHAFEDEVRRCLRFVSACMNRAADSDDAPWASDLQLSSLTFRGMRLEDLGQLRPKTLAALLKVCAFSQAHLCEHCDTLVPAGSSVMIVCGNCHDATYTTAWNCCGSTQSEGVVSLCTVCGGAEPRWSCCPSCRFELDQPSKYSYRCQLCPGRH